MGAASSDSPDKHPRILLIESDAATRQTIHTTLGKTGYVVVEAADSEDAARLLEADSRREAISTIICDIRAAKIKGVDAVAYFHIRYPSIPIIVTASYRDIEWAIALMKRGAADYLVKPVARDDLLMVIKSAVHRHMIITRGLL